MDVLELLPVVYEYISSAATWVRVLVVAAAALALTKTFQDQITAWKAKVSNRVSEGDLITMAGYTGTVETVSPLGVTLKTLRNTAVFVPTSKLEDGVVVNHAVDGEYHIRLDIPVAGNHDVHNVKNLIGGIAATYEGYIRHEVLVSPRIEDGIQSTVYTLVFPLTNIRQRERVASNLYQQIATELREAGLNA